MCNRRTGIILSGFRRYLLSGRHTVVVSSAKPLKLGRAQEPAFRATGQAYIAGQGSRDPGHENGSMNRRPWRNVTHLCYHALAMPRLLSIRTLVLLCFTSVTAVISACGSSEKSTCQGAERCDCYPNQTCNPGLSCMSNMCVATVPSSGGAIVPLPGIGGAVGPGAGGAVVPLPGTGGGVIPAPGTGGGVVPLPGTGGAIVPPPGTGGASGNGGSAGGPNLVKNGDFSSGKLYWDLTLQAGDVGGYSYATGQYCVSNESDALYLSFSLGYPSSPSDSFALEAGATYTFSYQVSGYGLIEAKIGGAVSPYTAVTAFSDSAASSTLKTITHVVAPTVSLPQAGLVFNGTLDYLEMVCFDNVSLVKN
jgi:hypothetical protein